MPAFNRPNNDGLLFHAATHDELREAMFVNNGLTPIDGQSRHDGVLLYRSLPALHYAVQSDPRYLADKSKMAVVAVDGPSVVVQESGEPNLVLAEFVPFDCFKILSHLVDGQTKFMEVDEVYDQVMALRAAEQVAPEAVEVDEVSGTAFVPVSLLSDEVVPAPAEPMSYDDWFELYGPIMDKDGESLLQLSRLVGTARVIDGVEGSRHTEVDPQHVWTLTDTDGMLYVQNGWHHVNRLHHFVCKNRWETGVDIEFEYDTEQNDLRLPYDLELDGSGPNTAIEYLYTDGSNYKSTGTAVFSGAITREQAHSLGENLYEEEFFDPLVVGMDYLCPFPESEDWDESLDHTMHRITSITHTDAKATEPDDISKLVETWAKVDDQWKEVRAEAEADINPYG